MSDEIMSLAKLNLSAMQQTRLANTQLAGNSVAKKDSATKESTQMEEAAEQFEAVFLQQMVNSMWNALPNEGLLSGSNEEALYRDMFNQAISEQMAGSQSLGIKDMILKEMKGKEEE